MVILKPEPIFDYTLWGDSKMAKYLGNYGGEFGTIWEISFHDYGSNHIEGSNKTLQDYLKEDTMKIIGSSNQDSLLRLCYLDARESLSVQLHPTIEYANKNLKDNGKYEAWYIIEALPGAKLAAGTTLTSLEELKASIELGDLEKYLIYHQVKAGDFIYLPAGCIHALGADILALEVSTNSNTTFRVFDYGRTDDMGNLRELHISQVLDNVDFSLKPKILELGDKIFNSPHIIVENQFFNIELVDVNGEVEIKMDGRALYISILGDSLNLVDNKEIIQTCRFDNYFVTAETHELKICGNGRVLISKAVSK